MRLADIDNVREASRLERYSWSVLGMYLKWVQRENIPVTTIAQLIYTTMVVSQRIDLRQI